MINKAKKAVKSLVDTAGANSEIGEQTIAEVDRVDRTTMTGTQ